MSKKENQSFDTWEGFNYFFVNNKLMTGPSGIKPLLFTISAIFFPYVLFLSFNSNFYGQKISVAVPIIATIFFVTTIVFIIIAAFSDPGIMQKRSNQGRALKRSEIKISQLGYFTSYKYCQTCCIIRPGRSNHCADCNNCVERFDHHCPWIGTCAAKRNYPYFFFFLLTLNILTVYMALFSLIQIGMFVTENSQQLKDQNLFIGNEVSVSFNGCIVSLFIIIYCGLSMVFTTGLFIYHIKLVVKNITTKEELKKFFNNLFGNPFKRNVSRNLKEILFPTFEKKSILDVLRQAGLNRTLNKTICKKNDELIELSVQKSHIEDVDTDHLNNSDDDDDIGSNGSNKVETEANNTINEKKQTAPYEKEKLTEETQEKVNTFRKIRPLNHQEPNQIKNKVFLPSIRNPNGIAEEKNKEKADENNQKTKYQLPKRKKKINSKNVDLGEITINLPDENNKQDKIN